MSILEQGDWSKADEQEEAQDTAYDGLHDDVQLFTELIASIKENTPHAQLNYQQVAVLKKRLSFISDILRHLPNPRPTPAILSVVRAGDYLIKKMRYTHSWKFCLRDQFTCRYWFESMHDKIASVWRLHSTARWVEENEAAIESDEVTDADLFLALFQPLKGELAENASEAEQGQPATAQDVIDYFRRRQIGGWRIPYEDLMRETRPWKRETKRRKRRQFLGPEGEKKRVEADGFRNRKGYYYRNHPVVVKEYELGKSVTRDTTNSTAKRKSQEKMDEDSLLFTNFIEDVVVRTQWCHPDIPQYYGAFTEKFVSEEEEEKALQEGLLWLSTHAREGDSNPIGRNGNASTTSSAIQSTATSLESLYKQSPVFAFSVTPLGKEEGISGERCEHKQYIDIGQYLFAGGDSLASGTEIRRRLWGGKNKKSNQYNSDYLRNTPRTALGLVMEDLSAELNLNSDSEEEDEMEHSEEDRSTLLTPSTHYQPLDRLLFSQGKKFTLVESIDITLQTADALQYMLLDKQKVPPEVSQMWMTISPSNVYVACVPAFADMDDGAGALEKGDIYSQLRTAGNSVVVFNDNDDDDLQRSGHQGSSVASFLVPTTTIALAPDGAPFADNTTGETNPLDSSPFGTPGKSQEDKGARSMVHQLHYIPIITRGTYAIKYNPPLFTNRPSAGIAPWRPHPCATSPPCYALGSLLLTLLTARPPTSPSGEPIRIPSHLPEQLVSFLRTATSTTSASPANANGTPPVSLTLAQFREQLWKHRIELQSCGAGDTTIKEGVPAQ